MRNFVEELQDLIRASMSIGLSTGSVLRELYQNAENLLIDNIEQIAGKNLNLPEIVLERFVKFLRFNLGAGKQLRANFCLKTAAKVVDTSDVPFPDKLAYLTASVLAAFCIECLQAFFLVADDIMDRSEKRRGKQCWYLHVENPLSAINDVFMGLGVLKSVVAFHLFGSTLGRVWASSESFFAKTTNCKEKPSQRNSETYLVLLELMNDLEFFTSSGQSLDLLLSGAFFDKHNLEELYRQQVCFKTAYYTFFMPLFVPVALEQVHFFLGKEKVDTEFKAVLCEVCRELGLLFQAQDDFLDVYGDSEITGKTGSDTTEGKLTWLILKTLEVATPEQKNRLVENYGVNTAGSVVKIKMLFDELNLEKRFCLWEEQQIKKVNTLIEENRESLGKVYYELINMSLRLAKRKK